MSSRGSGPRGRGPGGAPEAPRTDAHEAQRAEPPSRLTARALLETRSVHFNSDEPFTHASGLLAPTYIDCRRLIGFPAERAAMMDALTSAVEGLGIEVVAGGETAGIPFAAWIAERMGLPMAYIRKKPKGYGRNARIEGPLDEGQRVLLVEDLTTDGGSKISFVDAIREAGAICEHAAVVFSYGLAEAADRLARHGVTLHALCTWADVIAEARRTDTFDSATLDEVEAFLADPRAWRATRSRE